MSDVTGKGAILEEGGWTDEQIRRAYAVGMRAVPGATHDRPCDDRDLIFVRAMLRDLALTHPTEPPSAGREGNGPSAKWALDFATRWSAAKDETSVKALAWNVLGAFREWAAAPSPEPQPSVRLEREEIARIIDPKVMTRWDGLHALAGAAEADRQYGKQRARALAKADAIISSARSGGE